MVSEMYLVAGNEFKQLSFRSQRRFGIYGQADPGGDAEDMRVNGHIGLVVYYGGDDIGRFAADTREAHEFIDGQGYLAAEIIDQHLGHADQVFRLVVGIRNAADEREQVIEIRFGKAARVRIFFKYSRGGHIDPLIGALRRQDNRYQKLVGAMIQQLGGCIRIVFAEIV